MSFPAGNIFNPISSLAWPNSAFSAATTFVIGNGTIVANYLLIDKMMLYQATFRFGSTTSFTGALRLIMPTGVSIDTAKVTGGYTGTNFGNLGVGTIIDDSAVTQFPLYVVWPAGGSTTTLQIRLTSTPATLVQDAQPVVFAVNDTFTLNGAVPIL